jgi:hypothetical protein
MPMPVVTGDIVLIQPVCTLGDQTALNNVHFRCDTHLGGGATDAEIAAWFEGNLAPLYKAILTTPASWYGLLAQKIWPLPLYAHAVNRAHTGAGTAGTQPAPTEACSVIATKTSLAGRAYQGRVFLPFPDIQDIHTDGRTFSGGYQSRLGFVVAGLLIAQNVVGAGGSSHLVPVIYHRAPNKAGTTTAHGTTDITLVTVEDTLAVQRRRGPRGRANPPPV